jgi:uncharacterized membrane protein YphA (DoxX/SURF4 family)
MKIMAREYETANKTPSTAILLKAIGTLDFLGAFLYVLAQRPVFSALFGELGGVIRIALGLLVATSAAALAFVLAEMLTYLHAIRWNTDGYTVKQGRAPADENDD